MTSQEPRSLPKRPYRDGAIVHGVLAVVILLIAWLTGGDVSRAVLIAAAYFALATGWTWWRFRQRLAARGTEAAGGASSSREAGE